MKQHVVSLATQINRSPKDRLQLAKQGKFVHPKGGAFELTRDVFESFIDNFHLASPTSPEIPIDYNHQFEKAGGWIKGLEIGDDGHLYATPVEWTPQAVEEISSGQYKYLSIAFLKNGKDEAGVEIGPQMLAVSLTNIPFLRGLDPVSVELEDEANLAALEIDSEAITALKAATSKERGSADPSQFAYVDYYGEGHLPIHDKASVEDSMTKLASHGMSDADKARAARKIVGRAHRLGVAVSEDFRKTWNLEAPIKSEDTTTTTVATTTSSTSLGTITVNLNVAQTAPEKTSVSVEEPEQKEEQAPTPKTDEGDAMLEGKIREALGLSEKESIEDAITAVAKTRVLLSGQGENSVVPLYDFTLEQQKVLKLERSVAEKDIEISKLKEEHTKELRRRDAEALVGKAMAEGRITPEMKKTWALDMATRSPEEFNAVLASMPRMVRVKEEGSDEEVIVMSAVKQFEAAISKLREDYTKAGKSVPSLKLLQQEVATSDPKLYQEVLEETRIR